MHQKVRPLFFYTEIPPNGGSGSDFGYCQSYLLSAFNVQFQTNVWLPEYIGLGKGAALGFGMVGKNRFARKAKQDEVGEDLSGSAG